MGLADDTRVKVLLGGFLLSLFALVGVVSFGLLAALSVLAGPPSSGPFLFVLLDAVAPYVVASVFVGMLSLLLLVGVVVSAVRRASLPRNERLANFVRILERYFTDVRALGLSEKLEPTTEDRIEDLKQRYVEGEITELEYERRLQDLLADDGVSDERIRREQNRAGRERTEYEFER